MTAGPSRAFRRWCAAATLLVVSWSLPGSVYARVSPMEIVKYQLRKPNFLIVVESAESMQGISGENPTRFNEVGADCQDGDRFCRLYGQLGRCEFSGMGAQGYVFDYVSAGTATASGTLSRSLTMTVTQTTTGTLTSNTSAMMTSTASGISATAIATATTTFITSASATGTTTSSSTATETVSQTGTQTVSNSQTNTQTGTQTVSNSQTKTQSGTQTISNSQTKTQTGTQTISNSQTNTQTGTQTASNSQTNTQTGTQTLSNSQTNTHTATQSSSSSQTNTVTATQTTSSSASNTQTASQSSSNSASGTQTATQTTSSSASNTQTASQSSSSSASSTQTATHTTSSSASQTQTANQSSSNSASGTRTATQTTSSSASGTVTATQTTSSSASGTVTATQTTSSSASQTQTATQTTSSSASQTQTASQSSSSSASGTVTATQTTSSSASQTQTATQTTSSSASQTQTASQSSSSSASSTRTASQSSSSSASQTQTATQTTSSSASQTQTASQSSSSSASSSQTASQTLSSSASSSQTASQTLSTSASSSQTATRTTSSSQSSSSSSSQTYTSSATRATTSYTTANNIGTDTNIRGYWSLDENGGPYADTSGNNNDGTATGPPTVGTYQVAGKSAAFASTAQYVTVNMSQPAAPFSISAWVQVNDLNNINRNTIVAYTPGGSDNVAGGGLRLFLDKGPSANGSVVFDNNTTYTSNTVRSGYGVQLLKAGNGFSSQNWIFVVATVSGTTWTIYFWSNGRNQNGSGGNCGTTGTSTSYYTSTSATAGSATFPGGSTQWCFGAGCTGSTIVNGLVGSLDEVRMWDRAVTAAQAANLCTCNYVTCPPATGTRTTTNTETIPPTSTYTSSATRTTSQSSSASSSASSTYTKSSSASSSASSTYTKSSSASSSASSTYTKSSSASSSASSTYTKSSSSSSSGSSTYTNTASLSSSASSTYTSTASSSSSGSSTYTNTASSSSSGSSTYTITASSSASSSVTYTYTGSASASSTATMTNTASSSSSGSSTYTITASSSGSSSGTYSNTASTSASSTATMTNTASSSATSSSSYTRTISSSVSATSTFTTTASSSVSSSTSNTGTATSSASSSVSYTYTGTSSLSSSASYTSTGTSSVSASVSYTSTATSSVSSTVSNTSTATSSVSASAMMTTTGTSSVSASVTGTQTATRSGVTGTATNTVSESISASGTVTRTATAPAIVSYTDLTTNTETLTGTQTLSATVTATSVLQPVPDLNACDPSGTSCLGNSSYCYLNSSVACTSDSTCANLTPGDFCRLLNINDGSGRALGDFCSDRTNKTCRYQQATTCSGNGDCSSGVGDYCVFGTPAKMCQKTGLWCGADGYGCDTSSGDVCVPATSRLMMVKNAVRRVVLEHAYDDTAPVKIGQMHTFQADRSGDTTKLFAYVKLQTTSTRTDVKYLPRSELLKGVDADGNPCFSESSGPSSKCTIDYGGGGAVSTPAVEYHLQATNNSRYAVPTGDGKTYARQDTNWTNPTPPTGCGILCPFPSASTAGYGLYEGSYYTFSYTWGQPVDSGTGSVSDPVYSTTYLGKSYSSGGGYYYLMDAERSEYVNENKYGANEFTGSTWSKGFSAPGTEYHLPLVGAHSGDPLSVSLSSATCGPSNGAQWDRNVVPMVNDTTFPSPPAVGKSVTPTQKALMNAARLEKASYGGFYATGNLEPVACTLKDDNGPNDKYHSVDGYMSVVKGSDSANNTANGNEVPCWENHVLLVVDGLPRGPGDVAGLPDLDHAGAHVDCSASACEYDPDANPNLDGCHCPAVTRARALAANGVNVHVIAATTNLDPRNFYAAATLNNIARAGSTERDFINIPRYATSEDELYYWLNYEMKEALRITVATTPGSAANGSLSQQGVTAGNSLFQTTTELPEWRGNLVGFSIGTETVTSSTTATATQYKASVLWDAAAQNKFRLRAGAPSDADRDQWKKRRVFFSDATGEVRSVLTNDGTGTINPDAVTPLLELKLGADAPELTRIVEWMLGKTDPNDSNNYRPLNPAVMGSVLNSVPIDVGPPGANTMPGGNHFWYTHDNRPELVYVGADDGMLHAFQAADGTEAFAFIPADQVPTIAKLYAQGGQRYSPNDHVYGLAGSPKVKNLCVANCNPPKALGCSDELGGSWNAGACPVWKTILVVGDGPGGNHPFALDITDPFEAGVATLKSSDLLWHVGYKNAAGISATHLGETDSVPAFAYHQTADQNDYRVLVASGYPYPSQSSDKTYLIDATALEGASSGATGPGAEIPKSGPTCAQEFTALADVAVARDYSAAGNQNLVAAYVGDTWGTLHQYAPAYSPALDNGGPPLRLGCHHPLHFSPAVVQLTRVNASQQTDAGIFLAQVTNSILDPLTVKESSDFPASMLVVAKLSLISNGAPALDQTFGSYGSIQLSADPQTSASNRLCGVTAGKASTASDCGSGGSWLPQTARPTGTPVAIIHTKADGFQILTTWYDPPADNWDNCPTSPTSGNSYVTLHEFIPNGTWAQIVGFEVPHQYVTGVQFVGTTVFITTGEGSAPSLPQPPAEVNLGQNFQAASKNYLSLTGDRFVRTAWSERLDTE